MISINMFNSSCVFWTKIFEFLMIYLDRIRSFMQSRMWNIRHDDETDVLKKARFRRCSTAWILIFIRRITGSTISSVPSGVKTGSKSSKTIICCLFLCPTRVFQSVFHNSIRGCPWKEHACTSKDASQSGEMTAFDFMRTCHFSSASEVTSRD